MVGLSFLIYLRRCALDSNPGPQDGSAQMKPWRPAQLQVFLLLYPSGTIESDATLLHFARKNIFGGAVKAFVVVGRYPLVKFAFPSFYSYFSILRPFLLPSSLSLSLSLSQAHTFTTSPPISLSLLLRLQTRRHIRSKISIFKSKMVRPLTQIIPRVT